MVTDEYPLIQLDVTESYSISLNNKLTSYPVESRSNISDHIFSDNIKIQFTANIGHAKQYYQAYNNLIKTDQDNAVKSNRPQQAYDLIKKIRDNKLLVDLLTEQELFENVCITELSVSKETGTDQLTFNIGLEKPRYATIGKTVLAQINTNKASVKNKAANKSSEGSKNSGDTTKEENKSFGFTGDSSKVSDWEARAKSLGLTPEKAASKTYNE